MSEKAEELLKQEVAAQRALIADSRQEQEKLTCQSIAVHRPESCLWLYLVFQLQLRMNYICKTLYLWKKNFQEFRWPLCFPVCWNFIGLTVWVQIRERCAILERELQLAGPFAIHLVSIWLQVSSIWLAIAGERDQRKEQLLSLQRTKQQRCDTELANIRQVVIAFKSGCAVVECCLVIFCTNSCMTGSNGSWSFFGSTLAALKNRWWNKRRSLVYKGRQSLQR